MRIALRQQRQSGKIDDLLKRAEDAIRKLNFTGAMDIYRQAVAIAPNNPLPRMKLGLLCRDHGIWDEALEQFTCASEIAPNYPEAWRDRGIVENKVATNAKRPLDRDPAPGEVSLRLAGGINDRDFDAYSSLGGVLKRAGRLEQSRDVYEKTQQVSGGHPYPLLNALNLRASLKGKLGLSGPDKIALARAQRFREGQAQQDRRLIVRGVSSTWPRLSSTVATPMALSTPLYKVWSAPITIGSARRSSTACACSCPPLANYRD